MNYYYLIAGLPDVSPTDREAPLSPAEVIEELLQRVEGRDRQILDLYLHRHDNANLLALLSERDSAAWDDAGLLSRDALTDALEAYRQPDPAPIPQLPAYMDAFLRTYLHPDAPQAPDDADDAPARFALSRLSELYYEEATKLRNRTLAAWFTYERTLGNLLTALNCRRLGLDAAPYIIGHDATAQALRTSTAPQWGLTTADFEDLDALLQIADEPDAVRKERRLDDLRWQRLEERTIFCHFGIERLFAFLVHLDIIRRWQRLDASAGEARLRRMIEALKEDAQKGQTVSL
jgi:hypothetical protein